MGMLKSGILLRDRAYVPDHDSHDEMLKELGIQDDYIGASEKFLRFELSPKDGNLLNDVSTWTMKVDQDIIPAWFEAEREKYDVIIVDAVREWAEKHIIKEGKHEKSEGIYYLINDAEITLFGNAQATQRDNAQATLWGDASIGNSDIFDNAIAISHKDSKVYVGKKWNMEVIS